jgi:hypothetical protein
VTTYGYHSAGRGIFYLWTAPDPVDPNQTESPSVNNKPSAIAPDVCVIYLQLRSAISMLTEPFLDK